MIEWLNGGMKFGKVDICSFYDFVVMVKFVWLEDFEGCMVILFDFDVYWVVI